MLSQGCVLQWNLALPAHATSCEQQRETHLEAEKRDRSSQFEWYKNFFFVTVIPVPVQEVDRHFCATFMIYDTD